MKKIILLALTALMMAGCSDEKVKYKVTEDYYIVEIDSCEYVRYNPAYGFQHKGNCRFCKERDSIKLEKSKKELEELVIKLKEE